jgi:glycosidase
MIKYTYFPKRTKEDTINMIDTHQDHSFDNYQEFLDHFIDDCISDDETVFLVGARLKNVSEMDGWNEIYIHENSMFCEFFLSSHIFQDSISEVYLMEFDSYESAYELALDLREGTTDLCYSK